MENKVIRALSEDGYCLLTSRILGDSSCSSSRETGWYPCSVGVRFNVMSEPIVLHFLFSKYGPTINVNTMSNIGLQ